MSAEDITLLSSVRYIKGVGPARAELLAKLGVFTVWDLLHHYPRVYQDRSTITPIEKLEAGTTATIRGTIVSVRRRRARGRVRTIVNVSVEDGTGMLRASWFNQPYLSQSFRKGDQLILSGKVRFYDMWQMASPDYEVLDGEDEQLHTNRIVPLYPLTAGLSARVLRNLILPTVRRLAGEVPDVLPREVLENRDLCDIETALVNIHFPESEEALLIARERLKYQELFLLEIAMAMRRRSIKGGNGGVSFAISELIEERIRRRFPFELTQAQDNVIEDLKADMIAPQPMNRLLQGDVGSGKTVVAMYATLIAVANKFQTAIMAPTEILAEQHMRTFRQYLAGSNVRVELLVGRQDAAKRRAILEAVASGEVDVVIGTQALIQKKVEFAHLGFVVVDEQHKFGVLQRGKLRWKGKSPDVLVMTATPIPRTLALTVFGDLDVSTISELPPGRQPIKTQLVPRSMRERAWDFVEEQIDTGRQAFVVYPLVEESEKMDLKAAIQMAKHLRKAFSRWNVGLLHGKMKPEEKEEVMSAFREGRINLLVSTIVVEVGIDVPNATVMVIENAERFGLAQLHQLRGRIGRGEHKSHCLLFNESRSQGARQRLKVLTETSDGFKIAEEDLKMRGPGEFFGTLQSGMPRLRIADLAEDFAMVCHARDDAFSYIDADPELRSESGRRLLEGIDMQFGETLRLGDIG